MTTPILIWTGSLIFAYFLCKSFHACRKLLTKVFKWHLRQWEILRVRARQKSPVHALHCSGTDVTWQLKVIDGRKRCPLLLQFSAYDGCGMDDAPIYYSVVFAIRLCVLYMFWLYSISSCVLTLALRHATSSLHDHGQCWMNLEPWLSNSMLHANKNSSGIVIKASYMVVMSKPPDRHWKVQKRSAHRDISTNSLTFGGSSWTFRK